MARKYNKTSDYWVRRKEASSSTKVQNNFVQVPYDDNVSIAAWSNDSHYTAVAACGGATSATSSRDNWAPAISQNNLYPNLSAGIMPFAAEGGYYTMQEPIKLAVLAYFNIPLVRNTINLLQDFSCSDLKITCQNKTVKTFIAKWLESIRIDELMSQFFLEYYRSGNIFLYKFNGKISDDKFDKLKTSFGAKSDEIPIRYIILDPKQVYLQVGPTYNHSYVRMLSTFELQRLRDPQTPEDKQMLKSFPPDIQKQIKQYSARPWIYAPLDTKRLYYCFYRKMDYEPLAVPMIFPLLNQLEYKLMLQRMDMSLVQTMEQVFLLVTSGERADQYNPRTNPRALSNLQAIFKNQAIGRVLVADHTTKAEWKIPDLGELLGKAKYEQVDKDIRDGLGYQFFGEDKFANATVKARLFAEGLKEGRRTFLQSFLLPEIKKICEAMNFKTLPKIDFEKVDLNDKAALQRLYLQMAQLGLLTPQELTEAIETDALPNSVTSVENQKEYKELKEKGLYQPLIQQKGGSGGSGDMGRPQGGGGEKTPKKVGVLKGSAEEYQFDLKKVVDIVPEMAKVQTAVENTYKKQYKLKSLDDAQLSVAQAVAKSIVLNESQDNWLDSVKAYIKEPKDIDNELNASILDISTRFETDIWTAIALHKSRK